jgi:hypothetical protein
VLYRVGTVGTVARKLAFLLVVEGFVLITAEFPEWVLQLPGNFYESHGTLDFLLGLIHHVGDGIMIILYPPFLALALNTNLTRPFASTPVRIGLAFATAVLVLAVVLTNSPIITMLLYATVSLVFIYALVASIHAWRTAYNGLARERAGIFAIAFGVRDLGWCLSYAISAWLMWNQSYPTEPTTAVMVLKIATALSTLLAVPLIAYGVLRSHLFDIDLRIRWTIKQSTLAAAIVVIMFVVSESTERLLSSGLGNVASFLVAAAVVFLFTPLQRFAERVAIAAMPNTHNTPEYAVFRKMQVYEAAVLEALVEGGISSKERSLLIHLRNSLGVSESDADAIELELQAANST